MSSIMGAERTDEGRDDNATHLTKARFHSPFYVNAHVISGCKIIEWKALLCLQMRG